MLKTIRILKNHRSLQEGTQIELRPGANLIVGDNGTGKSTLLKGIAYSLKAKSYGLSQALGHEDLSFLELKEDGETKALFLDAEKDNPRTLPYVDGDLSPASIWQSHGQAMANILATNALKPMKSLGLNLLILDEPDTALSIRALMTLSSILHYYSERGVQFILSSHNETLIRSVREVYSLEDRAWMTPDRFLELEALRSVTTQRKEKDGD